MRSVALSVKKNANLWYFSVAHRIWENIVNLTKGIHLGGCIVLFLILSSKPFAFSIFRG